MSVSGAANWHKSVTICRPHRTRPAALGSRLAPANQWKHLRKGTKRRVSRAFVPLVFRLPSPRPFPFRNVFQAGTRPIPLLLPARTCRFGPCAPGRRLPVFVPPPGGPQKSRCATSKPWRTSDTSPFALPRKVKPPKRTHSSHSNPKVGVEIR